LRMSRNISAGISTRLPAG